MRELSDLQKIDENKFYFYKMFRTFVIEFDTKSEMDNWVKDQEKKDKYFGYDGYWMKNGIDAKKHFSIN